MNRFPIFVAAVYAFFAALVFEWRPHIVLFTSISVFLFMLGIDILLKKDSKTEFAIKITGLEVKFSSLGIALLVVSSCFFALPFVSQDFLDLNKVDALFGYKKYVADDIEGRWRVENIRWQGRELEGIAIKGGTVNFSKYRKSKGRISVRIQFARNNRPGQFAFDADYRHSFDKIKIDYNTLVSHTDSTMELKPYNWYRARLELSPDFLRMYWVDDDESHNDTFQLKLVRVH